ncbi:winged helix-turn-helix domain-containing protein [Rhodocaloribacter sp.]
MESCHHTYPRFRVGAWVIEPEANRITGAGTSVRVEPKVMRVLLCLADRPGETLTREALLEAAWPGVVVEENALSRAVSRLRKVLRDDPRRPSVIETIPKMGYRLIAPVTYDYRGDAAPSRAADLTFAPAPPAMRPAAPHPPPARRLLPHARALGAFMLAALVVAAFGWMALRDRPAAPAAPRTVVPFTSFPGIERRPAFSPDGRRIVFSWSGPKGDNVDLYVQLLSDGTPLRLTDHPAAERAAAWSPDGARLAFVRRTREGCAVYTVAALGGPARKLAGCPGHSASALSWSPDGRTLALSTRDDYEEPYRLTLLDLESLEMRPLTTPPDRHTGDGNPAFSPDGRRIAFIRSVTDGVDDTYVIPVAGGEARRLTHDARTIAGLGWTPDGARLVFSSNRTGAFKLWQISSGGGAPEWLASIPAYDPGSPVLAPDGRRMAFVDWFFDFNLWRWDRDAGPPVRIIASTQWEQHPQLSPDGARVAFASNRSGSREIWVAASDGTDLVRLTGFDAAYAGTPQWSPDGRTLAFAVRHDGPADLYRLDAEGGKPVRLTDHPADDLNPSWSHDGRWIYFTSNRSGRWQIWKMPSDGGAASMLTHEGGYAAREAPDGQSVYFTRRTEPGLWRTSTRGGPAERILDVPAVGDWGNWAVTTDGLLFVERLTADHPTRIVRFDPESGARIPLLTPGRAIPRSQPALSATPDGARLLFTQLDRLEADVMLVEDAGFER